MVGATKQNGLEETSKLLHSVLIDNDEADEMEPAMALAIIQAIAADDAPEPMPSLAALARVVAKIEGKISTREWEDLAAAGAALWRSAMGPYEAEQLPSDAISRARRRN